MVSKFAVVGHPNKGKSSLVATLAQNDSVTVSELSGTTTQSQYFDFIMNGDVCYQLIDTPGFQRARILLEELKQKVKSVADRKKALQDFVANTDNAIRFPDEFQLLTPIVNGAAIIYMVDGSTPYSVDYEPEMEILQWTGQPRMAVINPISGTEYVDEWQPILDQYFSIVRLFNPLLSRFEAQIDLLSLFSTLRTDWKSGIDKAIVGLHQQRQEKISQAARIVMAGCERMLQYYVVGKPAEESEANSIRNVEADKLLYASYSHKLRRFEQDVWLDLKQLFAHTSLEQAATILDVEKDDLFDEKSWQFWGLPRKTVIMFAAGSGAATGALLDVSLGGSSLMLGAAFGGIAGGSAATFFGKNLTKIRLAGLFSPGKLTRQLGPIKNTAFSWSILGRQIYYANELLNRNHSRRDRIKENNSQNLGLQDKLNSVPKADRFKLVKWLNSGGKKSDPIAIQHVLEILISAELEES